MTQLQEYFSKVLDGSNPAIVFLLSVISYLFFPDEAYATSIVAVGVMMILDILTKFWALSRQNGGYVEAVKTRAIYSRTLWERTQIKLVPYLAIMIGAGLSYQITPLKQLGIGVAVLIYSMMFFREFQSILENLLDGGGDVGWLLFWVKRKQKQILETEIDEYQEISGEEDDYENRV